MPNLIIRLLVSSLGVQVEISKLSPIANISPESLQRVAARNVNVSVHRVLAVSPNVASLLTYN